MIDLHTHSTASDGTLTPGELVAAAEHLQISAMALTDHDTVAGLPEFVKAAAAVELEGVPGVEVACSWYGFSLHLLGLFIDWEDKALLAMLDEIRTHRKMRNRRILVRLQELKIDLTLPEVEVESRKGGEQEVVGRPHIAQALVKRGYCGSSQEAFEKYLGRQAPAYVRRFLPQPQRAIDVIHQAGGVAVLAHPFGGTEEIAKTRMRQKMMRLARMELDAVEVYYCDYTAEQERVALELAAETGLLLSGGSDFHGDNSHRVQLGSGYGNLVVPDDILRPLQTRAGQHRKC